MGAGVKTHGIEVLAQGGDRVRVVRHIKHQHGLARHDLKTPGQLDQGQSVAHRLRRYRQLVPQGAQGCEHAGGVEQLVGPAQGRVGQPRIPLAAPAPAPLLLVAAELKIGAQQPQVGTEHLGRLEHALRRGRIAHDHRLAGAHDAGLLPADGLTVGPEELHVVQIDAGDDGAVGVDEIDRIEPATEPNLQNHHVQLGMGHDGEKNQRRELEIGQRNLATHVLRPPGQVAQVTPQPRPLHQRKMRKQRIGTHRLAAQAAALLKMHQMRRGVKPDPVTRLQQNRLKHRAGRALAVGAGHRDHRTRKPQSHAVCDGAHPLQAHFDAQRMQALAVGQPLIEGVE